MNRRRSVVCVLLLFSRALSLCEELVREDPEVFSEKLAELLKMIVRFYAEQDDREDTMKYLGQLRALVQDSEE
ncbi:MAG TPA: hypothetical protein O0X00_06010 [Methanocorpusculum sp.]|nr:hypothetical protein [Methanocorpusculum sp.]